MRGAWIEMIPEYLVYTSTEVAPPCGARGLKFVKPCVVGCRKRSRPHAGRVD